MIATLARKLKEFFLKSSVVHIRFRDVESVAELVELYDRFLNDKMAYDLEWDDFISWENDNPHIEKSRDRIGEFEPLLFSGERSELGEYCDHLLEERNRLASLLNIQPRQKTVWPRTMR
jgi:hypothetical protein